MLELWESFCEVFTGYSDMAVWNFNFQETGWICTRYCEQFLLCDKKKSTTVYMIPKTSTCDKYTP